VHLSFRLLCNMGKCPQSYHSQMGGTLHLCSDHTPDTLCLWLTKCCREYYVLLSHHLCSFLYLVALPKLNMPGCMEMGNIFKNPFSKTILIPAQEISHSSFLLLSACSLTKKFSIIVDMQFENKKVSLTQISFITDQISLLIRAMKSITNQ